MGEVYRAHDTKLQRDVALKVLPETMARDGQGLTRTRWTLPLSQDRAFWIQFDVYPDGRYLAFQTNQVLQENISMIENVR